MMRYLRSRKLRIYILKNPFSLLFFFFFFIEPGHQRSLSGVQRFIVFIYSWEQAIYTTPDEQEYTPEGEKNVNKSEAAVRQEGQQSKPCSAPQTTRFKHNTHFWPTLRRWNQDSAAAVHIPTQEGRSTWGGTNRNNKYHGLKTKVEVDPFIARHRDMLFWWTPLFFRLCKGHRRKQSFQIPWHLYSCTRIFFSLSCGFWIYKRWLYVWNAFLFGEIIMLIFSN